MQGLQGQINVGRGAAIRTRSLRRVFMGVWRRYRFVYQSFRGVYSAPQVSLNLARAFNQSEQIRL